MKVIFIVIKWSIGPMNLKPEAQIKNGAEKAGWTVIERNVETKDHGIIATRIRMPGIIFVSKDHGTVTEIKNLEWQWELERKTEQKYFYSTTSQ